MEINKFVDFLNSVYKNRSISRPISFYISNIDHLRNCVVHTFSIHSSNNILSMGSTTSSVNIDACKYYWTSPGTWFTKYGYLNHNFYIKKENVYTMFLQNVISIYINTSSNNDLYCDDVFPLSKPLVVGLRRGEDRILYVNSCIFEKTNNDIENKVYAKINTFVKGILQNMNDIKNIYSEYSNMKVLICDDIPYRVSSFELSDCNDSQLNTALSVGIDYWREPHVPEDELNRFLSSIGTSTDSDEDEEYLTDEL